MKIKEMLDDGPNLEGPIDEIIKNLQEYRDYYSKQYKTITLSLNAGYNSVFVEAEGEREETKAEKNARMQEKKAKEQEKRAKKEKQLRKLAQELNAKVEL